MFYQFLADVVVAIHFAYVSYVVFGELLILVGIVLRWQWIRNFWFRISHLLMIAIVAAEALAKIECPLTTWERELLNAADLPQDGRSFIGRLLDYLIFFQTPPDNDWIWPWIYCGFAALVLLSFILAPPRWRGVAKPVTA